MPFQFGSYLKFLLKSSNQHGVHSPFVYDLVTECFYDTKKRKAHLLIKKLGINTPKYKVANLLNRIPKYFKHQNALVLNDEENTISQILSVDNTIKIDKNIQPKCHYDILYLTVNQLENYLQNEMLFSLIHNNSILIVNTINRSKKEAEIWNRIKQHPKITVTIDTFYLLFVFIRTEQAKEDFTIRL